jgi:N-sulfoglucosamine sulfohydrolase
MMAIREAAENGTLPKAGLHLALDQKPDEELFDLLNDPWELNNLANDPTYQDKLIEMRTAHARWSDNTKDSGLIPETIMRSWEKKYGKSIYEILREKDVPISEIREAALGKDLKLLTVALDHPNEAVRYWAAISLGNLADLKNHEGAITKLKGTLNDGTDAVRIASARALCKTGKSTPSIDLLQKELNNEDGWVRLLAAQVLDEIGEDARPAEKELQKRIDVVDPNKYVVRVANHALNVMNGTNNVVK